MRDIKYRAWNAKYNTMVEVGAIDFIEETVVLGSFEYRLDKFPIMQFTGLKDRNGKDIYEGDLLRGENGIGEIEWVQEHCAFMIFTRNPSVYHKIESDGILKITEVIGNVWENPSLLEVTNE